MTTEHEFRERYRATVEAAVEESLAVPLREVAAPVNGRRWTRVATVSSVAACTVAAVAVGTSLVAGPDEPDPTVTGPSYAASTPASTPASTSDSTSAGPFTRADEVAPPAGLLRAWELYDAPGTGLVSGRITFAADRSVTVELYGCGEADGEFVTTRTEVLYARLDVRSDCTASSLPPHTVASVAEVAALLEGGLVLDPQYDYEEGLSLGDEVGLRLFPAQPREPVGGTTRDGAEVPDVRGLTAGEAAEDLRASGIVFQERMFGVSADAGIAADNVRAIVPAAGTVLSRGQVVQVFVAQVLTRG